MSARTRSADVVVGDAANDISSHGSSQGSSQGSSEGSNVTDHVNVVVLAGVVSGTPTQREAADGRSVWSFDLAVRPSGAAASAVPVTADSALVAGGVATDLTLVVVGSVRRRFFRTGGTTQSRTEVVASAVVAVSSRRTVARALERACRSLGPEQRATLRSAAG